MLCKYTGPRIVISFTRCTRRWVIISKNEGGNANSKLTRHYTTSFCTFTRFLGSIAFCEIALRNAQSFTSTNRTFSGRTPLNATGSNYVINMWKLWAFRFVSLLSFILIIPFILDKQPDGTFIPFRQSNMMSFSSLLRV
jgi:hypothetical protein